MQCLTNGCDRPRLAKGLCRRCYSRVWAKANRESRAASKRKWESKNRERTRETHRAWARANKDRRNAKRRAEIKAHPEVNRARCAEFRKANPDVINALNTRNRARRRGVRHEPYKRIDIFVRDGWTCQLCGEPINPKIKFPDVMSKTIDHVEPIIEGGADASDNVQAAHYGCNCRKGARAVA